MTDLEVRCANCNGTGVVLSSDWWDWADWWRLCRRTIDGLTGAARLAAIEAFERDHPEPDTPEGVACGECDGTGYRLLDDGRRLIEFIRRHWGQS